MLRCPPFAPPVLTLLGGFVSSLGEEGVVTSPDPPPELAVAVEVAAGLRSESYPSAPICLHFASNAGSCCSAIDLNFSTYTSSMCINSSRP